jgi:predicted short-subunit dehydrogenase-like oxidoreductase (DUF2520 family)
MRIALVGPGRAGTALAIAMQRAGHDIVAVVARDPQQAEATAARLDALPLAIGDPIPPVDLVVIAVRDGAIGEVAAALAPVIGDAGGVVHLSGATPVAVLQPLAAMGIQTGSFHPLQTLPTAEVGAERLDGAWIAVTASPPLADTLAGLATSFGGRPFDLEDEQKSTYHAAAAAAANFPIAALAVASDLFDAAGVPFEAAKPLVEAIVANAFDLGPGAALTGPVARGDAETVAAQLAAVAARCPEWEQSFRWFVAATADVAGTTDQLGDLV